MTLSDLASIGSLVSGVAVLASLVYLNLQTRQSAINQRSLMQQGRVQMTADWMESISGGEALAITLRGNAGDNTFDVAQYVHYTNQVWAVLFLLENNFIQHRMGVIDEREFSAILGPFRFYAALPGFRAFWLQVHQLFDRPFASFLDGLIEKTPVVVHASEKSLERWKILASEQIADASP